MLDPETNACPNCQGRLMADGWCPTCARKRGITLALALFILGPILGIGICVNSINSSGEELGWAIGWLGAAAPLLALFVLVRALAGSGR